MSPEDIKKLTDTRLKAEQAARGVTSASLEVKAPIRERGFALEERYKNEGIDAEGRQEIGKALVARVSALENNLWAQDDRPQIKPAFRYPHKETKVISAEGFVPLYITLYHEDGPDADPVNRPEGHITLTDENEYWGLSSNDRLNVAERIDWPHMHAQLEDDINTLERLHESLEVALPG